MASIFLSYRRNDSRANAGRLYDYLKDAFGAEAIFKDTQAIPAGVDFRAEISRQIASCRVMLVLIGQRWHRELIERHKQEGQDWVRYEIETALASSHMTVIPVLLDGAPMPPTQKLPHKMRQLTYNNAVTIHDDPSFYGDVEILVKQLEAMNIPKKQSSSAPSTSPTASKSYNMSGNAGHIEVVEGNKTTNTNTIYVNGETPYSRKLNAKKAELEDAIDRFETDLQAMRYSRHGQQSNMAILYLGAIAVGGVLIVTVDLLLGVIVGIGLFVLVIMRQHQSKDAELPTTNAEIEQLKQDIRDLEQKS